MQPSKSKLQMLASRNATLGTHQRNMIPVGDGQKPFRLLEAAQPHPDKRDSAINNSLQNIAPPSYATATKYFAAVPAKTQVHSIISAALPLLQANRCDGKKPFRKGRKNKKTLQSIAESCTARFINEHEHAAASTFCRRSCRGLRPKTRCPLKTAPLFQP